MVSQPPGELGLGWAGLGGRGLLQGLPMPPTGYLVQTVRPVFPSFPNPPEQERLTLRRPHQYPVLVQLWRMLFPPKRTVGLKQKEPHGPQKPVLRVLTWQRALRLEDSPGYRAVRDSSGMGMEGALQSGWEGAARLACRWMMQPGMRRALGAKNQGLPGASGSNQTFNTLISGQ